MITKEEFTKYILNYQAFEQAIKRMEEAFSGRPYGCNLFECDWVLSVDKMLDVFIDSHFTEKGSDWIYYTIFEDVEDHKVIVKKEADMFNKEEEIEYHLNTLDELWDFLLADKKLYFKNAE
jgi:hypothetical protein